MCIGYVSPIPKRPVVLTYMRYLLRTRLLMRLNYGEGTRISLVRKRESKQFFITNVSSSSSLMHDHTKATAVVTQANAYMNATFCIAAARCGWDDGHFELIGSSHIVDPEGHVVAESQTLGDELIVAEIDIDACLYAVFHAGRADLVLTLGNTFAGPARNVHFASRSTDGLNITKRLPVGRELLNPLKMYQ